MGPTLLNFLVHVYESVSKLQSCSNNLLVFLCIFCKVGSSGGGLPLTVHVRVKEEPFFIRVVSVSSVVVLAFTRNIKYYGKLVLLYLFAQLNNKTVRSIIRRFVDNYK